MQNTNVSTDDQQITYGKITREDTGNKSFDSTVSCRHIQTREAENVVILQGGGSLGAFGCGALKGLLKKGLPLDIVCGTSIGAINGAVLVGNKNDNMDAVDNLENFWMEIAESSYNILPDMFIYDFDVDNKNNNDKENLLGFFGMPLPLLKRIASSPLNAATFGVPKMFVPRWDMLWLGETSGDDMGVGSRMNDNNRDRHNNNFIQFLSEFNPSNWTYVYDHSPLRKTLEKYIDYKKISPAVNKYEHEYNYMNRKEGEKEDKDIGKNISDSGTKTSTRLIVTAVNVMTSEPLVFDSFKMDIKPKHLLACSGYPVYGFPWIEVEEGVYGWDGSLLNNTPLREVIQASPRNDKNVFIVENYPRKIDNLPSNMVEVLDRTRDIIFSDKTKFTIRLSKVITRQIQLIEDLYDVFENADKSKINKEKAERIKKEYDKLINNHGAEILSINRIIKDRAQTPNILKNADFSVKAVRKLIDEGERKALDCINRAKAS